MKLLVSVINEKEALIAYQSRVDIIDIKNPREGSLGANFPPIILKIRRLLPKAKISATIGDMPNLPGTASLAGFGAAACGVNYVKVGLYGIKKENEATYFLENLVDSVKKLNSSIKVVAVCYADYRAINSLNPLSLPKIAKKTGIDIVMIDVKEKRNGNLFEILPREKIKDFIRKSKRKGLTTALAGSLNKNHIGEVWKIGADIFGVRGAVCSKDRNSAIEKNKLEELVSEFEKFRKKS
ncbi:MAG: (5-formylfuran-3-yl)methyl phosphate synthase [Candidatus Aenigmatarchaeota archaeon]